MFLYKVIKSFDDNKIDYAIVGGFALALHGAVRGTVDLDFVVRLNKGQFHAVQEALEGLGLVSRLPVKAEDVFNFREEYIKNRNLIAWSFSNPKNPSEVVDIIITEDVGQLSIKKIKSGAHVIKVASIRDLIRMKKKSGRPQDLEDIKALQILEKSKP